MTDLFWPGDARAGELLTSQALVEAMVRVEAAWAGLEVTALPAVTVADLVDTGDPESGGNPVLSLVQLLRARTGDDSLHRGLTSQDVVDTALMLLLRDTVTQVHDSVSTTTATLAGLVRRHRDTAMVARTLTQQAVPTTFGLKAAGWLAGLLDARDDLMALDLPVQLGGAGGTNAALLALGRDPVAERARMAEALGLGDALPWHTGRRAMTRVGDALVATTDACGRLARDVLVLARPEIGELAEGSPGGSSTMPHKQNPVLSVLIRRAALTTPGLGATLHLAAADQVDERADGAWHAEWATLRDLGRRTAVAASQTADLVGGLVVHPDRMAATLAEASDAVRAEARAMGADPTDPYLGEAASLVDQILARAERSGRPQEETDR